MKYEVELSERFKKEFRKFDKYTQKMIRAWINKNLVGTENPRLHGKGLTACNINDNKLIILALSVGHRRDVNKKSI